MNKNALETTNFNFYGDELIAEQDNATGEIYTAINAVLRGIWFTDEGQIRRKRDKWINDPVIGKGITIFKIPSGEGCLKKDTPSNYQEAFCISQRKLPFALAKINITPKMKQSQPELSERLELYQDKCADVLASVFIDKNTPDTIDISDLTEIISQSINNSLQPIIDRLNKLEAENPYMPKQHHLSAWYKRMAPKYKMLMDYFGCSRSELYSSIYKELEDTYDIDINLMHEDYCYKHHIPKDDSYIMDMIEHNEQLRNAVTLWLLPSQTKYCLK